MTSASDRVGAILGRGLAFPPRVGADGRLCWSAGEDNIRESIAVVLKTEPGERIALPTFGDVGLEQETAEPGAEGVDREVDFTVFIVAVAVLVQSSQAEGQRIGQR